MIAAGLVASVLALLAAPTTQLATPPTAPRIPEEDWEVGASVSVYSGLGALRGRTGWNRVFSSTGYEKLDPFVGEIGARVGFQLHGLELATSGGLGITVTDGEGKREVLLTSLFFDAGYDLVPASWYTLQPTAGFGWLRSSLCFTGQPTDAVPPPVGSPIGQILRAPGKESCLDADSAAVRVGFLFGLRSPEDGGALMVGIRPTFTLPFAQGSYRLRDEKLPPLAGPDAPHAAFMVNVEFGFGFGGGRRAW